uniref:Uncharacterized protein n=1 Tax=Oryza brachyantha TaxID=4533 RepID=J3LE32_ORYBR
KVWKKNDFFDDKIVVEVELLQGYRCLAHGISSCVALVALAVLQGDTHCTPLCISTSSLDLPLDLGKSHVRVLGLGPTFSGCVHK